jgi:hypothetical protein
MARYQSNKPDPPCKLCRVTNSSPAHTHSIGSCRSLEMMSNEGRQVISSRQTTTGYDDYDTMTSCRRNIPAVQYQNLFPVSVEQCEVKEANNGQTVVQQRPLATEDGPLPKQETEHSYLLH